MGGTLNPSIRFAYPHLAQAALQDPDVGSQGGTKGPVLYCKLGRPYQLSRRERERMGVGHSNWTCTSYIYTFRRLQHELYIYFTVFIYSFIASFTIATWN